MDDDSTDALKKKAAAYLSDLYNSNSTTLSPLTLACPTKEDDVAGNFDSIATPPLTPSTPTAPSSASSASSVVSDEAPLPITANNNTSAAKKTAGKKRTYQQYASSSTPTALDILTQSAAKKLAMAANGELPAPILTDEDFLAQAGALLASANTSKCIYTSLLCDTSRCWLCHCCICVFPDANADKPYKCNVPGCQKAYKNPNGLKYHNQHGHCDLITDESENIASKPYQCTIGDCGKRYKNLNGLKYHIEHSHMAALNHTLASFGSSLFAAAPAFAAAAAAAQQVDNSANPTPEASPQASPVMSAASLAAFF